MGDCENRTRKNSGNDHRRGRGGAGGFVALVCAILAVVCLTGCSAPLGQAPTLEPVAVDPAKVELANAVGATSDFWTSDAILEAYRAAREVGEEEVEFGAQVDPSEDGVELGEGEFGEGYNFLGVPQVGVFFYHLPDSPTPVRGCTGAVVKSLSHSTVVSAAHCWPESIRPDATIFIPELSVVNDQPVMPFGVWSVDDISVNPAYAEYGDIAADFAVLMISPDARGNLIEEVTSGFPIHATPSRDLDEVEMIGYPGSDSDDETYTAAYPRHCRNSTDTWEEEGTQFFRIECSGMASGVSGGPWLVREKADSPWEIVALTGGGQDGGGWTTEESIGVSIAGVRALIRDAELSRLLSDDSAFFSRPMMSADADTFTVAQSSEQDPDADASSGMDFIGLLYTPRLSVRGSFFSESDASADTVLVYMDGTIAIDSVWQHAGHFWNTSRVISLRDKELVGARALACGDVDGSGYDDVVVLLADGKLVVLQDPGLFGAGEKTVMNPSQPLMFLDARSIELGTAAGSSWLSDDSAKFSSASSSGDNFAELSPGNEPAAATDLKVTYSDGTSKVFEDFATQGIG